MSHWTLTGSLAQWGLLYKTGEVLCTHWLACQFEKQGANAAFVALLEEETGIHLPRAMSWLAGLHHPETAGWVVEAIATVQRCFAAGKRHPGCESRTPGGLRQALPDERGCFYPHALLPPRLRIASRFKCCRSIHTSPGNPSFNEDGIVDSEVESIGTCVR